MTTTNETTADGVRRATVSFPGDTGAVVDELTARRSLSIRELVRRSIAAYKHLDDAAARGAKVLIQEPDGSVRELLFLY